MEGTVWEIQAVFRGHHGRNYNKGRLLASLYYWAYVVFLIKGMKFLLEVQKSQ